MKMRRLLALILALIMALSLVACGNKETPAPEKEEPTQEDTTEKTDDTAGDVAPLKIGVLYPLTGASATAGAAALWSAQWAVDHINNELGGLQSLGGAKIELVVGDTQGDAETALNEFERLVNVENVSVLYGLYNSAVANAISQYCIANKVPCQSTNAVADDAYSVENDYVFHANACNGTGGFSQNEMIEWRKQTVKPGKKYAFVYDSADFGRDQYNMALKNMEANGFDEIVGIPIEAGAADFSAQILKLKNEPGIEWVEPSMNMNDAILFVRQMKEYEVALPIFAQGGGFLQADFIEQAGDAADYVFSSANWFPSMWKAAWDLELAESIVNQFYDENGWLFDEAAALSWLGIWSLWDALERAGSYDRDDIAKAMAETDISGEHMATLLSPVRTVKYEDGVGVNGVMVYNQNFQTPVAWGMVKDGEYHVVWPEELAEEGYWQWPIPSWDER